MVTRIHSFLDRTEIRTCNLSYFFYWWSYLTPLHEEIFIQFNYQKAVTNIYQCFYRGHLEISASVYQHQLRHWHRHCKKIWFCLQNLFFENRIFMFFPVLSFGISTILLQILISLWFPFHPSKGVYWCSRKRLVGWTFGSTHPLVFWKNNYYKNFSIFCILSSETPRVEFFLSTFADFTETFPKRSLEQLFWREPVSVCFCKKELHSTRYLRNFLEF